MINMTWIIAFESEFLACKKIKFILELKIANLEKLLKLHKIAKFYLSCLLNRLSKAVC
jgi:hypothetical protein